MVAAATPDLEIGSDGRTVAVTITMAFKSRGGRRLMIAPDGRHLSRAPRPRIDGTLVMAKAFRWNEILESDEFATVSEIASAEKTNISYVSHLLRLTLLATNLVEAILDGRQPPTMQMQQLMRSGFSVEWERQRNFFTGP